MAAWDHRRRRWTGYDRVDRALTALIDAPEPLPAPQTPAPVPDTHVGLRWWHRAAGPTGRQAATATRRHRPALLSGTDQGEAGDHVAGAGLLWRPTHGGPASKGRRSTVGPAALREARRGWRSPSRASLPVLVIDAPTVVGRSRTGRAGRPDRAWPSSSRWDTRPCRSCWARAAAAGAGDAVRRPGAGRTHGWLAPCFQGASDRVPTHCPCRRTRCRPRHSGSADLLKSGIVDTSCRSTLTPQTSRSSSPYDVERHAAEVHALRKILALNASRLGCNATPDRAASRLTRAHFPRADTESHEIGGFE